jgi:hypothetical protein
LHRHFFSSPFGSGCLGPGKAYSELMEVHRPLRTFFESQLGASEAAGSSITYLLSRYERNHPL